MHRLGEIENSGCSEPRTMFPKARRSMRPLSFSRPVANLIYVDNATVFFSYSNSECFVLLTSVLTEYNGGMSLM